MCKLNAADRLDAYSNVSVRLYLGIMVRWLTQSCPSLYLSGEEGSSAAAIGLLHIAKPRP
jgi:hypothetical protein